ncbi:hypothetical protein EHV15_31945 [Paenibacillus oralis]|uniref:Uncharacterized protein n=1 Tax=Paenibacillus oralis TaxID=2490856 RepID=A0A3P3U9J6_9BACL|nr:hypothetical protein [Paenibacillus oralis]RRJ67025.1 hypothetical protein EHV15_31945 [Paenibacillus oralis]
MNKHTKMIGIVTVSLLAISLAACSGKPANPGNPGNEGNGSAGNQVQENNGSQTTPEQASETKQAVGTFVGLIDNHSVEIKLNGVPTAFQMDETLSAAAQEIAEGTAVEFEYVEKAIEGDPSVKQLVLTKLLAAGDAAAGTKQDAAVADLPSAKTIEVELEGMKEERTAQLAQGNGYALYTFDGFSFDAKANRLMMNYDNEYHVDIVKLPAGYNVDDLAEEAKAELSKTGQVEERSGDEIYESMRDASLFLIASGDKLTREYIVKDIGGQGYAFKINMPHGEASEGFGPLAYASLNSIVATAD